MAQHNTCDNKYWKINEWKKLFLDEQQQIFDDRNTWNLGLQKISDNECQSQTNKTIMNFPDQ